MVSGSFPLDSTFQPSSEMEFFVAVGSTMGATAAGVGGVGDVAGCSEFSQPTNKVSAIAKCKCCMLFSERKFGDCRAGLATTLDHSLRCVQSCFAIS